MAKLSKQQVISEIVKCGKSVNYFLKNYAKIQHTTRGYIDFKLFDYQEELNNNLDKHRFNIVLKARQLGISTIVAGYAAHMLLFHKDKKILILANKRKNSQNLLAKVKLIINSIPPWLRVARIEIDNRSELVFTNRSSITAEATTSDAGISEALSLLIVDEAAIIPNFDETWTAIYPTISTGGSCIVVSTPRGVGNQYHKLVVDAENGENEFHLTKLMWNVHPERDEEWFANETKNMSTRQIAREYLCSFGASGDTFLNADEMAFLTANSFQPIEKRGIDSNMWIFRNMIPGHDHLISVDVSRGDGNDYSTFHIIDLTTREQIASYRNKIPPDKFSKVLIENGKLYDNAVIVVENNSFGYGILEKIRDSGYNNIFYTSKSTGRGAIGVYANEFNKDFVLGFTTSERSRPRILSKLEESIRNKTIRIYDPRTIEEFKTFVWINEHPKASKGYNDDLIMALAFGVWVAETVFISSADEKAMSKAFINAISVDRNTFDGIQDDYGISAKNFVSPISFGSNTNIAAMKKNIEYGKNFKWLLD